MSMISAMVIGLIEKELSSSSPEVEQFLISVIGELAKDLVMYIEKKTHVIPSSQIQPQVSPSNP